jgi:alkaline phosphatase
MAKNDSDLFDRLRQAGLRKQVAKALSGIGDGANSKALRAARSAVTELRSLADELERRLPSAAPDASATQITVPRISTRSSAVPPPHGSRPRTGAGAGAAVISGARAPRGQNKARILESLKAGPKTASEIAKETGIGSGTVSTTLTKLAKSGELVKADRGYGLPG